MYVQPTVKHRHGSVSTAMADFKPDRSLLNPKFEGYKLQVISPDVARYDLPYKPTQVTTSGRSPLSLQEVHSRITHNHLTLSLNCARALYVDAEHRVVVVDVDVSDVRMLSTPIHNLLKHGASRYISPLFSMLSMSFLSRFRPLKCSQRPCTASTPLQCFSMTRPPS